MILARMPRVPVPLLVGFAFVGCATTETARVNHEHDGEGVVGLWVAPASRGPTYREDGEGPYPPSWPGAAIVCRYAPTEHGERVEPLFEDDATLFLVAAPGFDERDPLCGLAHTARFASPCSTAGIRGHWLEMSASSPSVYVFLYDSGGTMGLRVQVFSRGVWHSFTSDLQRHVFHCEFDGGSRIPPYSGDLNNDGALELYVATEATNVSGARDHPRVYRVLEWIEGAIKETGTVSEEELLRSEDALTPL